MSLHAQSVLILAVWWLSVAANGWVAIRVVSLRLFRRYPIFSFMIWYEFVLSVVLMSVGGAIGRPHPYAEIWKAVQLPSAVIRTAVALEAFVVLAGHFRNIRSFAVKWLMPVFIMIALGAAAVASLLDRDWPGEIRQYYLHKQHLGLVLLVVSGLSVAFFRYFRGVPIRRNALVYAAGILVASGSSFVAGLLLVASGGQWRFAANLAVSAGGVAAFVTWGSLLSVAGERLPFKAAPPVTREDLDRMEHQTRQLYWLGKEVLRKMRHTGS